MVHMVLHPIQWHDARHELIMGGYCNLGRWDAIVKSNGWPTLLLVWHGRVEARDVAQDETGLGSHTGRPYSTIFTVIVVTTDDRLQGLDFRNSIITIGLGNVRGILCHFGNFLDDTSYE